MVQQGKNGQEEQKRRGRQRDETRKARLVMTVVLVTMTSVFMKSVGGFRADTLDARRFATDHIIRAQRAEPKQQSRHEQDRCDGAHEKGYCGEIQAPRPLTRITSRHLRHHAWPGAAMPTASFLPKVPGFTMRQVDFSSNMRLSLFYRKQMLLFRQPARHSEGLGLRGMRQVLSQAGPPEDHCT